MEDKQTENDNSAKTWLKRIGIAGFLFFLLKGIGWLIFIYLGGSMFKGCGL